MKLVMYFLNVYDFFNHSLN